MDIRLLGRWRPRITLYWDGMPIRCPRAHRPGT